MNGLTGPISFDEHGHRVGYKLDVIELTFNSEPLKVILIRFNLKHRTADK